MGKISVHLQPKASADEIIGVCDGVLWARVSAPPVDGKANKALIKLLSRVLGLAASKISIATGAGGRNKVVEVDGLGTEDLLKRCEESRE